MVAATSVPNAKNRMGRAIDSIVDPWPPSTDPVWEFFESACAYCGLELVKGERKGHIDHATAAGGNHMGNLVLACAACNGDEKLDMPWRAFLDIKVPDADLRRARTERIERWQELNAKTEWSRTSEVDTIEAEARALMTAFSEKCAELRAAVARARAT